MKLYVYVINQSVADVICDMLTHFFAPNKVDFEVNGGAIIYSLDITHMGTGEVRSLLTKLYNNRRFPMKEFERAKGDDYRIGISDSHPAFPYLTKLELEFVDYKFNVIYHICESICDAHRKLEKKNKDIEEFLIKSGAPFHSDKFSVLVEQLDDAGVINKEILNEKLTHTLH